MNFWGYLINGAIAIVGSIISQFPTAQPNPLIANAPDAVTQVIAPVYFWVSPVVNLSWVGIAISVILVLETVRAVIAIWRWILTLIPAAS